MIQFSHSSSFRCLSIVWLLALSAIVVHGVSNQATAEAIVVNGFIVDVRILYPGDGYFTPPSVAFLGNGSGAVAVAQVQNGKVSKIAIQNAGFGYTDPVTVQIGPSSYPDIAEIGLYAGLKLIGEPGSQILLQYAERLDDPYPWQSLTNFQMSEPTLLYIDPVGPGKRYYRSIAIPRNPSPSNLEWIPPGSFVMGTPLDELVSGSDENPHVVTITEGFFMGIREVNQSEFLANSLAAPSQYSGAPDLPVENVSYQDAVTYCESLTQRELAAGRLPEGFSYRLPTEAEWEYATRARSHSPYFFGSNPSELDNFAWWSQNSGGHERLVKTKGANPWGLFDVYGNVAEWCKDYYAPYGDDRKFDPEGPATGTSRVVRGGSWGDEALQCRSASRAAMSPSEKNSRTGFRVVLAKGPPSLPSIPNPSSMIWLPPGSFLMGSPPGELGRQPDEFQHLVTLTNGFWVGKYLVTVPEFVSVTGIQRGGDPRSAVECPWSEATNYCFQLTLKGQSEGSLPKGWVYRLPTEAEWEYMARAGTRTRYFYGDDLNGSLWCTYYDCHDVAPSVGSFPPNSAGVYDILYGRLNGNSKQWCSDWYAGYARTPISDPRGPTTGLYKVQRGGPGRRSAQRLYDSPDNFGNIRIVLGRP